MRESFEQLLKAYRDINVHFLNIKTEIRELFMVLDDSYYLTYRDSSKEIVFSIPLKPKVKGGEVIYMYNTNNRHLDEWYDNVCEAYDIMSDRTEYQPPNYNDIHISYLNEEEKGPLKDFLALLPKTECKFFGNYVMFGNIGERLEKVEKAYTNKEGMHIPAQIRNWLHFDEEEMKPFNFEPVNPAENLTINLNSIREITPSPYSVRFIFDDGSIRVLKKILQDSAAK